jgi:prepilin-type N-terminal cleavage/methylation domain-containing protein
MNRRGFTLIELLTTLSIMGLVASIALPKYQNLRHKAVGAEIVANIRTLRLGAFQYNETSGTWPRTAPLGRVPNGVAPYLSGNGQAVMQGANYRIRWASTGVNRRNRRSVQTIQVRLTDGYLCQSVYGLMGGRRNLELRASCNRRGGNVFLTVDR